MPKPLAEFIQAVAVDALAQALGELLVWSIQRAAEAVKRKRPRRREEYQPKHLQERK